MDLVATTVARFSIVVLSAALMVVSGRRGWRPSLRSTLAVGLGLRVALLVVGHRLLPYDFVNDFAIAGENVLDHRDPILNARASGWNYLPTYALALAGMVAVQHVTDIPWLILGRLVPIAADLGVAGLVGVLAGERDGPVRRFQYACNPLVILVSAVHGQMEPTCLLLALGALVVLRRGRALEAGALFGLAISVKSWPLLLLPAFWSAASSLRNRTRLLGTTVGVLALLFATMPLTVGTPVDRMGDVGRRMLDYRPTVATWGWSSVLKQLRPVEGQAWSDPFYVGVGDVGTALTIIGVVTAVWWWRRADPIDLATATTSTFQVATAAHGIQYLAWVVPSLTVRPTRSSDLALVASGFYAAVGYFVLGSGELTHEQYLDAEPWYQVGSVVVIVMLVAALPWRRRQAGVPPLGPSAGDDEVGAHRLGGASGPR